MADDISIDDHVGTHARAENPPLGTAYWWLWTSAGLSNLADGVVKVGLPLVAVSLTRSPALIAGLTVAFYLPWLLFALPAGTLVDRLDRRRLMLCANTIRASLVGLLTLAMLLHLGSIWALYVMAFATGCAEMIYDISAQSIVPQLVARESLPRANGRLYAVELITSEFLGPPLSGVLVAAGAVVAFATPTGLWIMALGALLLVRGSFRVPREPRRTNIRAEIAEGLRYLWRHRLLRTFTIMIAIFNFTTNATSAVFVLYAVGPGSAVHLSEQAFGMLLSAVAAGSVLGSFGAPWLVRVIGRARSLVVAFLGAALLVCGPALTTNPYLIGSAFLIGGAGIITVNIVGVSFRQRVTPDRLLGRLSSSHRFVAYGTQPLGAVVGGALAELLGLHAVFVVMGLLALSVLAGMLVITDDAMDRAENEADAAHGD